MRRPSQGLWKEAGANVGTDHCRREIEEVGTKAGTDHCRKGSEEVGAKAGSDYRKSI